MVEQKFKGYSEESGLTDIYTLQDLMQGTLKDCKVFLQYLGYKDAEKTEIFEGDILELKITDELMNHDSDTFYNSNLGKHIEKEGNITSVILVNKVEKDCMSMDYLGYFCVNGRIERYEDGELEVAFMGDDKLFPQYLCCKGATVVGNIVVDKDFVERIGI